MKHYLLYLLLILLFMLPACSQLSDLIVRNETGKLLKGEIYLNSLQNPGESFNIDPSKEYIHATYDITSGEEDKILRQVAGLKIINANSCVVTLTNDGIQSITSKERSPTLIIRVTPKQFSSCSK